MGAEETLRQFPDRLGPVFVRELRQGLRSNVYVWAFLLFHLAAVIASLSALVLQRTGAGAFGGSMFGGFTYLALSLGFGILLPLSFFGTLQAEAGKGRNIELLLAAGLTRWRIVREKLFVSVALSGLLLVSLLPYLLLQYFLGSVELIETLGMIAMTMAGNAAMNAIVIGASGFANPVGRVFAIVYLYTIYTITAALAMIPTFSGGGVSSSGIAGMVLISGLAATTIGVLSLQLGRAKIKLFENPVDPPATAGVLALAFFTPIAAAIAAAAGGAWAASIVLALILAGALAVDRGPGRETSARGLQP